MIYKGVKDEKDLYLECNGGYDVGYMKPLQKDREVIMQEFKDRIKLYDGKLIESDMDIMNGIFEENSEVMKKLADS